MGTGLMSNNPEEHIQRMSAVVTTSSTNHPTLSGAFGQAATRRVGGGRRPNPVEIGFNNITQGRRTDITGIKGAVGLQEEKVTAGAT
jgi:hypothetical protein